jgi:acetylornithine/N-succinyldiaminopimelate aminotransferase
LRQALDSVEGVVEIQGRGLMVGIKLDRPCAGIVHQALEQGLIINVTAGNVIRLLPPLIIERAEIDMIVAIMARLAHEFLVVP